MLIYEIVLVSKRVHICFYLLTIYFIYGNCIYVLHLRMGWPRDMFFVIKIAHYMTHNAMVHSQTEVTVTR